MNSKSIFLSMALILSACSSMPVSHWSTAREQKVNPIKPIKLAVIFGGGGIKGYAHIGAIKALEEVGLQPEFIAGTSIGSLVGAMWADGFTADQIFQTSLEIEKDSPFDWVFFTSGGWIKGEKYEASIRKHLKEKKIEDFKIPFVAVGAHLESGNAIEFNFGDAAQSIRASCSMPGIFLPALIDGQNYVDGDAVSPVPVESAIDRKAQIIFAVDISEDLLPHTKKSSSDIVERSNEIRRKILIKKELKLASFFVRPFENFKMNYDEIPERQKMVDLGYRETKKIIPQIIAALSAKSH